MVKFNSENENLIAKCISSLLENGRINLAIKAREFAINYNALRKQWIGLDNLNSNRGYNKRFSEAQDLALVKK